MTPKKKLRAKTKAGWFKIMQPLQRVIFIFSLIITICVCFYLGLNLSFAIAPPIPPRAPYQNGEDWQTETNIAITPPLRLEGTDVVLLAGVDKRPDESSFRTDTIMLAFFNWDANEVKLLSIPRDSYVQLPGRSAKIKINEAYAYGGITLLENTIEYTFGIEVDHYIELDFAGFIKIIDLIGGVEIDVPNDMKNLAEGIDLKQGLQTLNGAGALGFVRYRERIMADIGRIERQQQFAKALAGKLATPPPSLLLKTPQLILIILNNCATDYNISQLMKLAGPIRNIDLANIETYSLQGSGKYIYVEREKMWINYWILNKAACKTVIEEIIGEELGEMHIIDDGGAGLNRPPGNQAPPGKEVASPEPDAGAQPPITDGAGVDDDGGSQPDDNTELPVDPFFDPDTGSSVIKDVLYQFSTNIVSIRYKT